MLSRVNPLTAIILTRCLNLIFNNNKIGHLEISHLPDVPSKGTPLGQTIALIQSKSENTSLGIDYGHLLLIIVQSRLHQRFIRTASLQFDEEL